MQVMVMVKYSGSEEGKTPTTEEFAEMGQFNEELVNAGIMLSGGGLRDSSHGFRIYYSGDKRNVVDGPFAEAKELIGGYWIWQVKSMDEATDWAKRIPFREGEVEVRQMSEADDFGEAFTPELREQEERLNAQMGANRKA